MTRLLEFAQRCSNRQGDADRQLLTTIEVVENVLRNISTLYKPAGLTGIYICCCYTFCLLPVIAKEIKRIPTLRAEAVAFTKQVVQKSSTNEKIQYFSLSGMGIIG